MCDTDVAAVADLATLAFEDFDRRRGVPPPPRPRVTGGAVRMRRVLTTDPGGCWVADGPDGSLAGAALAIVREGVWGLSIFAVRPGVQSAGLGRALLARALAHGAGARGGIILSSPDPRALRPGPSRGLRAAPGGVGGGRAGRDDGGASASARSPPPTTRWPPPSTGGCAGPRTAATSTRWPRPAPSCSPFPSAAMSRTATAS